MVRQLFPRYSPFWCSWHNHSTCLVPSDTVICGRTKLKKSESFTVIPVFAVLSFRLRSHLLPEIEDVWESSAWSAKRDSGCRGFCWWDDSMAMGLYFGACGALAPSLNRYRYCLSRCKKNMLNFSCMHSGWVVWAHMVLGTITWELHTYSTQFIFMLYCTHGNASWSKTLRQVKVTYYPRKFVF